jgi:TolB-like protein
MDELRQRLEQALAGTYQVERELGGGGMSRTYLARETALQRRVVIKVLAPELLAGISVERFRREVLLAAQLQHPHVVPVLTAGDVDGIPWFTMPYVDGDSLRHRLDKGGLGVSEAVSILRDVARALSYAHGQGVVHRDIKPDNVLLSSGSATVTDFGIAKAINAARTGAPGGSGATLTQVGTSIGTPTYMAPEQAAGDPDTDHRADIYAFGVMAYELISGRTPFQANTPTKLLAAHMGETPEELLAVRPDCPAPLADLVMRCLQKDPDQRPQEARELARVLDTVTTSGNGATVPEILRGGRVPLGRAIGLWAVAAVLVVVTAWAAREVIGLPEWVLPGAVGVMLAGLPILVATAYVQRATHRAFTMTPNRTPTAQGTMATLALKASPHLSWKRAWTGGAMAVGGFAALVVGFMVLRALGIGPMGSLQGKGVFGAHEMLVIADFKPPAEDSTLGATVAEALRTDLAQSSSLNVMTRSALREELVLMQRQDLPRIEYAVAREIATRSGAKAVLDGEVARLGRSYVLTARLVAAADGTELAIFREDAPNEDDLLPALGKLSKAVRQKAGESLKDIQASDELSRVTTPSLPALRKYVEGLHVADELGETQHGIDLLKEAVALDTAFAMAWRKLSVLYSNSRNSRALELEATESAYRHRDRLTEMERLLTEARYWGSGAQPDMAKALAAYEAAAKLDTLNTSAINNTAVLLGNFREWERAESIYRRVVALPSSFGGAFSNLITMQIRNGRTEALDSTVALFRARFPESRQLWQAEWYAAWGKGDLAAADSISRAAAARAGDSEEFYRGTGALQWTARLQGRLAEHRAIRTRRLVYEAESEPSVANRLEFALDTAWWEAEFGAGPRAARAAVDRGLARAPIDSIPPSERPWTDLSNIGAFIHDTELARRAEAGYQRDQAQASLVPEGDAAFHAANTAFAARDWRAALERTNEADRRFGLDEREAFAVRGEIFDSLGMADSVIANHERFLELRDPSPFNDAIWRAKILSRLGELHEGKGNTAKAIEYYAELVDLWRNADPALQPRVAEIRQRISRLQGEVG